VYFVSVYLLECKKRKGEDYRGIKDRTQKGVLCQKRAGGTLHTSKIGLLIFV